MPNSIGTPYRFDYTCDKLGRIATHTETIEANPPSAATTYVYNKAGELRATLSGGTTDTLSTYDLNGNRLTHTTSGGTMYGRYDAQDRLLRWDTATQSATYAYNLDGELLTRTKGGTTTTYAYDLNLSNRNTGHTFSQDGYGALLFGVGKRIR